MYRFTKGVLALLLAAGMVTSVPSPVAAHTTVCAGTGSALTPQFGLEGVHSPVTAGTFALYLGHGAGFGGCDHPAYTQGLSGGGTLSGWCGRASGSATLSDGGGTHAVPQISVVGSNWFLNGPGVVGQFWAAPLPGAGGGPNSCLNGTASVFQVNGYVVFF